MVVLWSAFGETPPAFSRVALHHVAHARLAVKFLTAARQKRGRECGEFAAG
jgi:hypothetical protein